MAFAAPQFNLLGDIWFCGNNPNSGDPDFENQECQLYLPSRVVVAVDRDADQYFVTPIQIRLPLAAVSNWQDTNIIEIPAESGRYFLAVFKEHQHMGFPNEYLLISALQCDGDGEPILRDVCSVSPVEHHAESSGGAWFFIDNFALVGAGHHGP